MCGLLTVRVEVSGVISSPVAEVWEAVCASVGNSDSYVPEIPQCHAHTQMPERRTVSVMGTGRLYEALVLFDERHRTLGYELVNDEGNVNPFSGSFVNYHWIIKLYPITLTNSTLMRIQASFQTEPAMRDHMQMIWESVYRSMIVGFTMLCPPRAALSDMPPVSPTTAHGTAGEFPPNPIAGVPQTLPAVPALLTHLPATPGLRAMLSAPYAWPRQTSTMGLSRFSSGTYAADVREGSPTQAGPSSQLPPVATLSPMRGIAVELLLPNYYHSRAPSEAVQSPERLLRTHSSLRVGTSHDPDPENHLSRQRLFQEGPTMGSYPRLFQRD